MRFERPSGIERADLVGKMNFTGPNEDQGHEAVIEMALEFTSEGLHWFHIDGDDRPVASRDTRRW